MQKLSKLLIRNTKTALDQVRILVMRKNDIEAKPIPSYLTIDGFELYVTYSGLLLTCKYFHEVGHMQSECEKCLADHPSLNKSQQVSSSHVKPNCEQPLINSWSSDQRSPINLSKKRKFHEGSSNLINTSNENSSQMKTVQTMIR